MDTTEKMRRTTTRRQFKEMIEQMKSQPDIARNLNKQSAELQEFWENLAETLNSMGPPFKEISEWKKVWTDFKSSLRKKLTNNKRVNAKEKEKHIFTNLEEEVIELAGLRDCVEGVPETRSFGMPRKRKFDADSPPPSVSPTVCFDQRDIEPIKIVEVVTREYDATYENGNARNLPEIAAYKTRQTGKRPSLGQPIVLDQIGIQKMLYEKVSAVLAQNVDQAQTLNSNFGKIFLSLNRISELEAKNNDILQALLDETKRHNRRMEKLALDKEQYLSDSMSE